MNIIGEGVAGLTAVPHHVERRLAG